ncbi:MAG: hypothetical protein O7D91_11515 [Planctomycetota bacterium]|nr:hypothetical protein [Planctomycetota bacterium]
MWQLLAAFLMKGQADLLNSVRDIGPPGCLNVDIYRHNARGELSPHGRHWTAELVTEQGTFDFAARSMEDAFVGLAIGMRLHGVTGLFHHRKLIGQSELNWAQFKRCSDYSTT